MHEGQRRDEKPPLKDQRPESTEQAEAPAQVIDLPILLSQIHAELEQARALVQPAQARLAEAINLCIRNRTLQSEAEAEIRIAYQTELAAIATHYLMAIEKLLDSQEMNNATVMKYLWRTVEPELWLAASNGQITQDEYSSVVNQFPTSPGDPTSVEIKRTIERHAKFSSGYSLYVDTSTNKTDGYKTTVARALMVELNALLEIIITPPVLEQLWRYPDLDLLLRQAKVSVERGYGMDKRFIGILNWTPVSEAHYKKGSLEPHTWDAFKHAGGQQLLTSDTVVKIDQAIKEKILEELTENGTKQFDALLHFPTTDVIILALLLTSDTSMLSSAAQRGHELIIKLAHTPQWPQLIEELCLKHPQLEQLKPMMLDWKITKRKEILEHSDQFKILQRYILENKFQPEDSIDKKWLIYKTLDIVPIDYVLALARDRYPELRSEIDLVLALDRRINSTLLHNHGWDTFVLEAFRPLFVAEKLSPLQAKMIKLVTLITRTALQSNSDKIVVYLTGSGMPNVIADISDEQLNGMTENDLIDANKLDELLINDKSLPTNRFGDYLTAHPELQAFVAKLEDESRSGTWPLVITDVTEFWYNHVKYLVYLHKMGFEVSEFRYFRRLVNNTDVVEILDNSGITIPQMSVLREKLGLTVTNLTHLDVNSIFFVWEEYQRDPTTIMYYKQMLAESPAMFKNLVLAIDSNGQINVNDKEVQKNIRLIIRTLGNITPRILERFLLERDHVKKLEFLEEIKVAKAKLFKNHPVKNISVDDDNIEMLADMISLMFPGTSVESITNFLWSVEDKCDDLQEFFVRDEGYIPIITGAVRRPVLKAGEVVDTNLIAKLQTMFPRQIEKSAKTQHRENLKNALIQVISSAGALSLDEMIAVSPRLFSILYDDQDVIDFRKTAADTSQDESVVVFLARAKELLGIYFKDNFHVRLAEVFDHDEGLKIRVNRLLIQSNAQRLTIDSIVRNLGKLGIEEDSLLQGIVVEIKELIAESTRTGEEQLLSSDSLARLVTIIIENKLMQGGKSGRGLRNAIAKERGKFVYVTDENQETADEVKFVAYVSKNAASFFAKTAAGICTNEDVDLFNWKNHFHINLVSGDIVVGNIQGYVIEHEGRRALLFRGFNPSTNFVTPLNVDLVFEGMVSVIRQFAIDNNIDDVFISEQTSWHPLTNRTGEGVEDYFKRHYMNSNKPGYEKVEQTIPITDNQSIEAMYRLTI